MYIQIQLIDYNSKKQPSFGIWRRNVKVPRKGIVNRNDTRFFRDETFFPELAKFFSEKFKDVPKVNVYCYGCSDGSEPFTFAICMLSSNKEKNPQKFFPILAKDIDSVAIDKARNNNYQITKNEKDYINLFTNGQDKRFFSFPYGNPKPGGDPVQVFARNELYDNVDFSQGNIFEDYTKINPKNSIVLARNFWPYVENYSTVIKFCKDLYKHLDFGSYFVIGEYDCQAIAYKLGDFKRDILKAGFKPTSLKYVFVKE